MTYYELFIDAVHKLNFNQITLGEYEEMIEPLKREIEKPCNDAVSRQTVLQCIKESREGIDWGQSEDEDAFLHYAAALYRTIASKECVPSVTPLQTREDCISRTEALKAIEREKQGWEGAERYAIDECHTRIAELPSVTPQQTRWIPVSEKMPQKTDYYLIQYSREVCPDEMAVAFYSVEEAEVDRNYTWEFKPIADCKEVIAWQPLPESYEEGSRKE